jgi:transcriptional regulator with XRE-family HTH domain
MPAPAPTGLRLRCDVWRRHCSRLGALTLAEKSELLHIDPATISRIERGSCPSGKFIARALHAITGSTFDELFETAYEAAS